MNKARYVAKVFKLDVLVGYTESHGELNKIAVVGAVILLVLPMVRSHLGKPFGHQNCN